MRLEGILRSWNEERGFGFIHPRGGGEDVFVHISAFRTREVRPESNQRVSFEVEPGQNGKLRARNVDQIFPDSFPAPAVPERVARRDAYGWLALLLFIFLYVYLAITRNLDPIFAMVYVVASVVTIVIYALDKYSAIRGGWRVSEVTLLLLGVVGGWPGAIVAQQAIRHKSKKPSFRRAFWATVVLNVALFLLLSAIWPL
ncbi:MAG: cold shock and DUF1294 domain-containing protein [Bryobacterales bacterium]|nr:cold shock and DUF1294 domain-containing protein [Bryobacterales bacterium]